MWHVAGITLAFLPFDHALFVTAGPEAALVASLVQRVAGGDVPEKEES
jgi:hypothetical protein